MPVLDGQMLYLRVNADTEHTSMMCLDSCEVVHGRFNFMGFVDSIVMAELCMGNERVMPLVLENGDLEIHVDHVGQRVSGGPLNERLYTFFKKKNRLENNLWELQQQSIRMMRKGESAEEIHRKISPKRKRISDEIERLETKFIMDNYNNVLGPGFFMLLSNQYSYPVMTNQIRAILQMAPPSFMAHPYVIRYVRSAEGLHK